jgi:hypothetical protein
MAQKREAERDLGAKLQGVGNAAKGAACRNSGGQSSRFRRSGGVEWNPRQGGRWGKSMFKITIDAMLLPSMFVFVAGLMVAGALANLNQDGLSQDRLSQNRQQPD